MWDYYPQAKLLAEQIAKEYPATTVVRPSWLYGPRDRISMPRVIPALLERRAPIIGSGENYLNIIYAGDVAAGTILAANHPNSVGQAFNLCSEGEVTQADMLNTLTDALALPRITKHVPYGLAIRFAFMQECIARLLRRAKPPTITRRAIYLIGRSTQYSTQKARMQLGWTPRVDIHEGIRRTLEWFVALPENRHLTIKAPGVEMNPFNSALPLRIQNGRRAIPSLDSGRSLGVDSSAGRDALIVEPNMRLWQLLVFHEVDRDSDHRIRRHQVVGRCEGRLSGSRKCVTSMCRITQRIDIVPCSSATLHKSCPTPPA